MLAVGIGRKTVGVNRLHDNAVPFNQIHIQMMFQVSFDPHTEYALLSAVHRMQFDSAEPVDQPQVYMNGSRRPERKVRMVPIVECAEIIAVIRELAVKLCGADNMTDLKRNLFSMGFMNRIGMSEGKHSRNGEVITHFPVMFFHTADDTVTERAVISGQIKAAGRSVVIILGKADLYAAEIIEKCFHKI